MASAFKRAYAPDRSTGPSRRRGAPPIAGLYSLVDPRAFSTDSPGGGG